MTHVHAGQLAQVCRQEAEISEDNFERLAARGKILTGVSPGEANEAKLEAMFEKGKAEAYATVANTLERLEAQEAEPVSADV